jgi:hypothetical protein
MTLVTCPSELISWDGADGFSGAARQPLTILGVVCEATEAEEPYNQCRSTHIPVNPILRAKGRFSRRLRDGKQERIVRSACLEPLGLSVTAGAKILGVTRQALNNVVNGKSGVSPEMAIRLTKAFGSTE